MKIDIERVKELLRGYENASWGVTDLLDVGPDQPPGTRIYDARDGTLLFSSGGFEDVGEGSGNEAALAAAAPSIARLCIELSEEVDRLKNGYGK